MPELRVLALTRYGRLGASSRVRWYQFLPALRREGIVASVAPLLDDQYLARRYAGLGFDAGSAARGYLFRLVTLLRARQYDVLWIEKELFPWLPGLLECLPRVLRLPYVVDYDDATFHTYDESPSTLVRASLGRKIATIMRHAAVVLAGNPYLAEYARAAGAAKVLEVPTVVDAELYRPTPTPKSGTPLRIGWIGTPITAPYLEDIAGPLYEVTRRWPAKLVTVGALDRILVGIPMEVRKWDETTEIQDIQTFDIGIMPIPDEPWERGKCGYKLVQYMGCGLPTVASPVGSNTIIVEHGRTGFLARSGKDWVDSLGALAGDASLRARMGQAGRKRMVSHYSIQAAVPMVIAALWEAATKRHAAL